MNPIIATIIDTREDPVKMRDKFREVINRYKTDNAPHRYHLLHLLPGKLGHLRLHLKDGFVARMRHFEEVLNNVDNRTLSFEGIGVITGFPDADLIRIADDGSLEIVDFTSDRSMVQSKTAKLGSIKASIESLGISVSTAYVKLFSSSSTFISAPDDICIPVHESLDSFETIESAVEKIGWTDIIKWGKDIDKMIAARASLVQKSTVEPFMDRVPTMDEVINTNPATISSVMSSLAPSPLRDYVNKLMSSPIRSWSLDFDVPLGHTTEQFNSLVSATNSATGAYKDDRFSMKRFVTDATLKVKNFKIEGIIDPYEEMAQVTERSKVLNPASAEVELADLILHLSSDLGYESRMVMRISQAVDLSSCTNFVESDANGICKKLLASIKSTRASHLCNMYYEIAKAYAASKIKNKRGTYCISKLDTYNCVVVMKSTGSAGPLKSANFMLIMPAQHQSPFSRTYTTHSGLSYSKWYTIDKRRAEWWLKMGSASVNVATMRSEHLPTSVQFTEVFSSTVALASLNRDTFSQVAEYTRYLYTSSFGVGASVSPLIDKINFYEPKNVIDLSYMYQMMKMAAIIQTITARSWIQNSKRASDSTVPICMPGDRVGTGFFQYHVNMFYICKLLNKEKADKVMAQALCWKGLLDEDKIFKETPKNFRLGVNVQNEGETFLEAQTRLCISIIDAPKQNRFTGSLLYIAYVAKMSGSAYTPAEQLLDTVSFEDLFTTKAQSIVSEKGKLMGTTAADSMSSKHFTEMFPLSTTSLSLLSEYRKVIEKDSTYDYRIVHKDQIGNREISVLNYEFRIMAFICETIHRNVTNCEPNVVEDPDKITKFLNLTRRYAAAKEAARKADNNSTLVVFNDNSDKSRWGPNNLMNMFYAMSVGLSQGDKTTLSMIRNTLACCTRKRAQCPKELAEYFTSHGLESMIGKESALKSLAREHDIADMSMGKLKEFPWGMCQGIYHNTSSVYASVAAKHIDQLLVDTNEVISADSLCTSDDEYKSMIARVDHFVVARMEKIQECVNRLMNIVKSKPKSTITSYSAELNSVFSTENATVNPTIKLRIGNVGIIKCESFIRDVYGSIQQGVDLIQSGGSLVGSVMIAAVNLAMTIDFWGVHTNKYLFSSGFTIGAPELLSVPRFSILSGAIVGVKTSCYEKTYGVDRAAQMLDTIEDLDIMIKPNAIVRQKDHALSKLVERIALRLDVSNARLNETSQDTIAVAYKVLRKLKSAQYYEKPLIVGLMGSMMAKNPANVKAFRDGKQMVVSSADIVSFCLESVPQVAASLRSTVRAATSANVSAYLESLQIEGVRLGTVATKRQTIIFDTYTVHDADVKISDEISSILKPDQVNLAADIMGKIPAMPYGAGVRTVDDLVTLMNSVEEKKTALSHKIGYWISPAPGVCTRTDLEFVLSWFVSYRLTELSGYRVKEYPEVAPSLILNPPMASDAGISNAVDSSVRLFHATGEVKTIDCRSVSSSMYCTPSMLKTGVSEKPLNVHFSNNAAKNSNLAVLYAFLKVNAVVRSDDYWCFLDRKIKVTYDKDTSIKVSWFGSYCRLVYQSGAKYLHFLFYPDERTPEYDAADGDVKWPEARNATVIRGELSLGQLFIDRNFICGNFTVGDLVCPMPLCFFMTESDITDATIEIDRPRSYFKRGTIIDDVKSCMRAYMKGFKNFQDMAPVSLLDVANRPPDVFDTDEEEEHDASTVAWDDIEEPLKPQTFLTAMADALDDPEDELEEESDEERSWDRESGGAAQTRTVGAVSTVVVDVTKFAKVAKVIRVKPTMLYSVDAAIQKFIAGCYYDEYEHIGSCLRIRGMSDQECMDLYGIWYHGLKQGLFTSGIRR